MIRRTFIVVAWRDDSGMAAQWVADVYEKEGVDEEALENTDAELAHSSDQPAWPGPNLKDLGPEDDQKVEALLTARWPDADVEFRP